MRGKGRPIQIISSSSRLQRYSKRVKATTLLLTPEPKHLIFLYAPQALTIPSLYDLSPPLTFCQNTGIWDTQFQKKNFFCNFNSFIQKKPRSSLLSLPIYLLDLLLSSPWLSLLLKTDSKKTKQFLYLICCTVRYPFSDLHNTTVKNQLISRRKNKPGAAETSEAAAVAKCSPFVSATTAVAGAWWST